MSERPAITAHAHRTHVRHLLDKPEYMGDDDYPTVVCLCGSTRFGEHFRAANLALTLAGQIVLSIGCEWHGDDALGLTLADKERLDRLHLRKIAMADYVYVINPGGYVGDSTRREIAYARATGKPVEYMEVVH